MRHFLHPMRKRDDGLPLGNGVADMTRYLVTGATGGLGRNAVQMLLAAGCRVRATERGHAAGACLLCAAQEATA